MKITGFLSAFFSNPDQPIFLRTFKPKGAPLDFAFPKTFKITLNDLLSDENLQHELVRANKVAGIYFVVNSGGNTDDEITVFSALYIENDQLSLEEQHKKLDAAPIAPSIRVITKKSVHAYWLLKPELLRELPALLIMKRKVLDLSKKNEGEWLQMEDGKKWSLDWAEWAETDAGKQWREVAARWSSTQKQLITYFGSDLSIHNPSRLMRLPFFDHLDYDSGKNSVERKRVEVHTFNPDQRFTLAEIENAFSITKSEDRKELFSANEICSFNYHEDRHAELILRISRVAKQNRKGNLEMRCPAHNGKGETSLVYFPASDAVVCNAKCSYFAILAGFGLSNESLPYRSKSLEKEYSAEFELHEKALHGPAAEFVRLVIPNSEADEAALLTQFLCAFGSVAGRNAYFTVEADTHYLNLFVLLVGGTSTGRKGTSWGYVERIFSSIDEEWKKNCLVSGLSSGEGLLHRVRDAVIQRKKDKKDASKIIEIETDSGIEDKRLLVKEGEFAQVLRVQGRESNTLSAMLRNFWDSGTHSNLVKNSPLKTTNAHISIVGHITTEEFIGSLHENETVNGYLNRFLMIKSRRSKLLPFGANLSEIDFGPIIRKINQAKEFAENVGEMNLSARAKELWAKVYVQLETGKTGIFAKVTQRSSPYVLRLACLYALLDLNKVVNVVHLQAALAVWQYAENTARVIFGGRADNRNAARLLEALKRSETGLTQTEIRDLFNRNLSADEAESILFRLQASNLIYKTKILTVGAKKPTTVWHAEKENSRLLDDINDFYDIYLNEEPDADNKIVNVVNIVREQEEVKNIRIVRSEREAIRTEHLAEIAG